MFPLGSVLFPHMPLSLRVFEERYLVLLARVLDSTEREFGVVLIERGQEVGGGDRRFAVGTMARVAQVAAGDDEIRLVAHGRRRFEIVQWLDDDPHPRAIVRDVPDLTWDDDLDALRTEVERVVRRVLARAAEYSELQWDADIGLSDDPMAAAWQLAAIAPLGPLDQVQLLRAASARELLTLVRDLTLAAEPLLTVAESDDDFDAEMKSLLDRPGGPAAEDATDPDEPGDEDGDGPDKP